MYCTYAASPLKLRPPVKSLPCARSPGWNELHWTRITKRGSTSVQHKERGQRPPARARLARGFTSGRGGRVGDVDGGRSPPHPIHPSSAINRCTCYRCHRQGGQPVCCTPVNPLAPPPSLVRRTSLALVTSSPFLGPAAAVVSFLSPGCGLAAFHLVNARSARSGVSTDGSPAMGRRKSSTAAFPPSRIKKMMQADDDVGKVATATPVLVRSRV